ncbi:hypothetical protein DITRI_Ditri16bG0065300 [Diplodiscus trichospermus]
MPIFRFIFFSSKHRFTHASNLLQRFGPSKRTQSCGYAKSAKDSYTKPTAHPIMNTETQTSRSWSAYVVVCCLGFLRLLVDMYLSIFILRMNFVLGGRNMWPNSYLISSLFLQPAALLVFGGFAAFVHYNDERRAIRIGQDNSCGSDTVAGPIIGGPFTLVNTEYQIVNEQGFLGNWVLLYFGYTSSPDVGPDQVQIMANAIDTLELEENFKVLPVFVTIDPQRDTLAHLRAYLKEFDPRIVGLTGPVSAVRQMAQEYRIYFKKVEEEGDDYLVESSHNIYLIDPKMKVVRCFGVEYDAEELSKEILKELKKRQNKAD